MYTIHIHMQIHVYIYIHKSKHKIIHIRRPLFRGCHQAARQQCSSYRTFYVMTVYCPSLIADCLMFDWYTVPPEKAKSTTHFGCPLDPWILVKQCSRSGGSAIQPILASPGHPGTQAMPTISPRPPKGDPKPSPAAKMDPKRHALEPPMADKWSAVSNPSKHRIVVSSNPEFRGRRQGAKPFRYIYIYITPASTPNIGFGGFNDRLQSVAPRHACR